MKINREIFQKGIIFDSRFLILELTEEKELIYKSKMYDSNEPYSEEIQTSTLKDNEFILEHCDGHLYNERIITLEIVHQLQSLNEIN